MSKDDGGSAFPWQREATNMEQNQFGLARGQLICGQGMTLRDYFAAKAMPLAMEDYRLNAGNKDAPIEWDKRYCLSMVALRSYELADAMLAERNAK